MANKDHYTYLVTWPEDDQEHVGLCAEFSSLSWMNETPFAAFAGIMDVVVDVMGDMKEHGEKIPNPIADRHYSGKIMVRVLPDTHRSLAVQATKSGISSNRIVRKKLAAF